MTCSIKVTRNPINENAEKHVWTGWNWMAICLPHFIYASSPLGSTTNKIPHTALHSLLRVCVCVYMLVKSLGMLSFSKCS